MNAFGLQSIAPELFGNRRIAGGDDHDGRAAILERQPIDLREPLVPTLIRAVDDAALIAPQSTELPHGA